jgi:hypothetical protein
LQIGANGTTGSLGTGSVSGSAGATLVFNLSTSGTITNAISGGLGVTQAGTGTLNVNVANITGLTSVTSTGTLVALGAIGSGGAKVSGAGTLIASGGITGDVNVAGGTLGDMASIGGSAIIGTGSGAASSSIFYPSMVSGTTTTSPSINGSLTLKSDSVFKFKLDSTNSLMDSLSVGGALILNNAVLAGIDVGSTQMTSGAPFILAYAGGGISGRFANLPQGASLVVGTSVFTIDYTSGGFSNNYITLQAVPEPQTWAMILGGLGVLGFWQSRPGRGRV